VTGALGAFAGVPWPYRAGGERIERRLCAFSGHFGRDCLAMTVITMLTVITGFDVSTEMKRAGPKSGPAPRNGLQTGLIPAKANLKGQEFWNESE